MANSEYENTARRCVNQLVPAERVDQVFLISQPQLRTTSRGDFYIAAFLSDSTGKLNGRMWQASETIFNALPDGGFVHVRGRTEMYQNSMQLVIESLRPVQPEDVEMEEFLPKTEKDVEQMFNRTTEILQQIKDPHLAQLCEEFLKDEKLMKLFRSAPAAITLHHAYLGGLLEHTLSVLELGCRILPQYPQLDADLVMAGLFLHDIGKTTELEYDTAFTYSDQGRLIGHLVKGTLLIQEKIQIINASAEEPFPEKLADCLEHIIVSHHGTREFGCPVVPAMPEAFAVHYIDDLDSKIALTLSLIDKDPGNGDWTGYIRALETPLFKRGEI